MNRNLTLSAAALAAMLGATLSTTALADRGGPGPMGMGPEPMLDFAEVDTNSDGKITPEELDAYRAARTAALDADKDGKISAAEMQAQIEARMKTRAAGMAARMVEMRDTDGDGLLSAAELAEPPMPGMAGMIFDRADADKDGAVTQAELDAMRDRMAERMQGRGHGRDHGEGSGWGRMFGQDND